MQFDIGRPALTRAVQYSILPVFVVFGGLGGGGLHRPPSRRIALCHLQLALRLGIGQHITVRIG